MENLNECPLTIATRPAARPRSIALPVAVCCLLILVACGVPDSGPAGRSASAPTASTLAPTLALTPPHDAANPAPSEAALPESSQRLLATAQALSEQGLGDFLDISQFSDQLRRTDLPPDTRQLVEQRLKISIEYAQEVVAGRSDAPKVIVPPPSPGPTPVRPRGILDGFNSPTQQTVIYATSAWQDEVNGHWVIVYTGWAKNDPSHAQGVVLICTTQSEGADYRVITEALATPNRGGNVTIIAVENLRFTLRSQDGTILYFDLPSRTFFDSQGQPLAPGPTPAPYIN
jgi:hypothetical protein